MRSIGGLDSTTLQEWRPIPGYEGIYEASSEGNIRRILACKASPAGRVLKPKKHWKGYLDVHLSNGGVVKLHKVHALVAAAFHGPRPEGMTIDHVDADKKNNRPGNLEYVTNLENQQRRVLTVKRQAVAAKVANLSGRASLGSNNGNTDGLFDEALTNLAGWARRRLAGARRAEARFLAAQRRAARLAVAA